MRGDLLVLSGESATYEFKGVPNKPVPSLFREFSAPVKVVSPLTQADQLFLARHDSDPFNRWQSLQDVSLDLMVAAVTGTSWTTNASDGLADALEDTVTSETLDPAFKARLLGLPSEQLVARTLGTNVDPDRIRAIRLELHEC